MTVRCFVDTNVLIHLHDRSEAQKRALTKHSLRSIRRNGELVVSPQVVSEFYALAAERFPYTPRETVRDFLRDLLPACRSEGMGELLATAWRLEDRYRLSPWDCLMAAAAVCADCRLLVTEALPDGSEVDRTRVVNPFLTDIETVFAGLKERG
ncbi:PIN domain protein [Azorhizobium caulinodans ORS 571]|uniref:Ribonuclease VapC n=1 Tax=Azorhizobium caulinodans (strain ATCC 43989 / DSM 5975 / JCM 20966 / LMG 6465 / NBRC 14845 / NCIMB 13405 / ORS 571) TaxID=438753 RepID=A8HS73_AZOC5|nr:PIN domain-containing protein [Azorhizobium caulinodans]BAF90147.1 PIN domain protein [Azorhizobium caulinodans ORS 571]